MIAPELPRHSEAKIQLLKAYLEAYLAVISRDGYTKRILIVDFFCGPGRYANDTLGSPLVIGNLLAGLHSNHPRAPETIFLFNDTEEAHVEQVEKDLRVISEKHPKFRIVARNSAFADLMPEVISNWPTDGGTKRFFFVDPFGYSQFRLGDLLRALQGQDLELLLFQPSSFMFRFSKKGTPEALSDFMSELSEGKPWPHLNSNLEYIHHTKNLFRARLAGSHYVDTFTIQKDENSIFCLFFFTPHIRGFEKMLEAKWKFNDQTGQGWHYSAAGGSGDLFDRPCPQTRQLELAILALLENKQRASNKDIYKTTIESGYLPKHARELLNTWEDTGRIRVDRPEGTRRGVFWLNYEDHEKEARFLWVSKVF